MPIRFDDRVAVVTGAGRSDAATPVVALPELTPEPVAAHRRVITDRTSATAPRSGAEQAMLIGRMLHGKS